MADNQDSLDSPRNVRKILRWFYVVCAVVLLLDVVVTRKIAHEFETLIGFYPIYGFVCCVVLVVIAKWMRRFVMRDEDYYDDELKEPGDGH